MNAVDTIDRNIVNDDDAIRNNVARVLSDIFSNKHNCKVNFRFERRHPEGSENA